MAMPVAGITTTIGIEIAKGISGTTVAGAGVGTSNAETGHFANIYVTRRRRVQEVGLRVRGSRPRDEAHGHCGSSDD
jgi:hypothetical protein